MSGGGEMVDFVVQWLRSRPPDLACYLISTIHMHPHKSAFLMIKKATKR